MRQYTIAIATIVIIVAMIAVSSLIFKPAFDNPTIVIKDAPLQKNAELQLKAGETYRYVALMNQSSVNITYETWQGNGCLVIELLGALNFTGVCLDRNGTDIGYDSTLSDPAIIMFRPWMLALKEGWHWNSSVHISTNGGIRHVTDTYYRVIRKDDYNGREAFLVEISSDDGPPEYQWIDAEKRILLRMMGSGYDIRLE
jgi:hypothetical protein